MANSGSFNTNSASGMYFQFNWNISSTDTSRNYDVISWSVTGQGGSPGNFIVAGPVYLSVEGNNYQNGGRINLYPGTVVLSGTTTIYHNNDGNKRFSANINGAIYQITPNVKGDGSWDLPQIPRAATITSAPNFNDEENPTITYSNQAGNSVSKLEACISFDGTKDDIAYREIPKTGNSYTFNLTDEERTILRKEASNSKKINLRFYVRTTIGGNQYHSFIEKTMTIVNANPIFENFTYEDINPITLELTKGVGFIANYSNIKITIPTEYKAIAKKEAKIILYRMQIGNSQVEANYSDNENITMQINNIASNFISVYAIDSRGNSTLKQISIDNYINYINLSENNFSIAAERDSGGTSNQTILYIQGQFWNGNFYNGTEPIKNEITSIKYQFRKTNEAKWNEGATELILNINDNNYNFEGLIKGDLEANGFSLEYNFEIKVIIKDKLSTAESTYILQSATPGMAIHRMGISFGKPYNKEEGGALQIKGRNLIKLLNPTILYEDLTPTNGTPGNVNLSDNLENYDYLEIYYARRQSSLEEGDDSGATKCSIKIDNPNGKYIAFGLISSTGETNIGLQISADKVYLIDNKIERIDSCMAGFSKDGIAQYETYNSIGHSHIYKVIGYKKVEV